MPATFFDIPPEVIEQILLELDPLDVAACSQTCRDLHALIYDPANELLWRKLYLAQPFDDPRKCRTPLGMPLRNEDIDWRGRLQRIIRARTVVSKPEACLPEERCTVIQTLLDMARNVPPLPDAFSNDISLNLVWLATLLRGGTFLDQPLWVPSHEETLLRSHLHTLFGLTTHDYRAKRRLESRSFVYDFRNYCAENEWAPLIPDRSGRVNWEHVLAIHHVISMHLVPPGEPSASSYTISPMSLPFTQSILPPDLDLDNTDDWAGIAGRWSCAFCFVDHRELLAYNVPAYSNFFGSRSATHDPSVFANPDFDEIFGGLIVDVTVTSTEHDPAHPTRPIIHFEGLADTAPNVKGWVRATPDDNIRWFFESGEGQAHRVWSSHGIVVGNVRSPYGVLGTWTSFQHQNGDPVGPFWMRKIPEAAP